MLDVVRFGQTTLDLRARTLRRRGHLVALQSRPFDLLALLVGHADSILTREAIQEAIWPDVVVEYDQNINSRRVRALERSGWNLLLCTS